MKSALAVVMVLSAAAAVQAHDHADCPMAKTMKHRTGVDQRHDEVTGVAHEQAVHHFLLTPTGGTIRLEATDADDTEARDRIRKHLQVVARSFAAGDFALPMLIHDQTPPGIDVMKKTKTAIGYEFSPTDQGGDVRISTKDAQALSAIHSFLRFQVEDHGTGEPTK